MKKLLSAFGVFLFGLVFLGMAVGLFLDHRATARTFDEAPRDVTLDALLRGGVGDNTHVRLRSGVPTPAHLTKSGGVSRQFLISLTDRGVFGLLVRSEEGLSAEELYQTIESGELQGMVSVESWKVLKESERVYIGEVTGLGPTAVMVLEHNGRPHGSGIYAGLATLACFGLVGVLTAGALLFGKDVEPAAAEPSA